MDPADSSRPDSSGLDAAMANNLLLEFLAQSSTDTGATAQAWNEAGLLCSDPRQAELAFHSAIRLDPLFDQPYLNLAFLKLKNRELAETVRVLEEMHSLFPVHAEVQFALALASQLNNEIPRAVGMLEQMLQADDRFDAAWELLRHCHDISGDTERIIETSRRWIAARPDSAAAQYLLKSVCGDDVPDRACARYVADSFDRRANRYDSIQSAMDYQGPVAVEQLLHKIAGKGRKSLKVLDAGCGSGLLAGTLHPYASQLVGIDLSEGMLEVAKRRRCYDRLERSDVIDHFAENVQAWDLIVAADLFCYFGDLETLIPLATRSLRKGGHLLFTVDSGELSPDEWFIKPNGRFGHAIPYIVRIMGDNGFPEGVIRRVKWRHENGRDQIALVIAITRQEVAAESGPD